MSITVVPPFDAERQFLLKALGPERAGHWYAHGMQIQNPQEQKIYFERLIKRIKGEAIYKATPVDIITFVKEKYFLGVNELYEDSEPFLKEMNSGDYVEIVLTGGIGSGKTTLALLTNAYQVYLLSCMDNPHVTFGLDRSSEIEIIFQSITQKLAESVDYARFKEMILRSPYFQKEFPPNPELKSELHFPNRVIVKPVSGSNLATIGQNVIGGLIDELNYMAVVDKSRKSVDSGTYDQAVALYNSIARRRKSRYYRQGKLPGVLCLVSSKKYPGQFTDVKMEEAEKELRENGKSTIYVYDKRVWDIKPKNYSKKKFKVFVGDAFRKPRIITDKDLHLLKEPHLVMEVPEDFKIDFERDIVDSLREIAGVSHVMRHPFFADGEKLYACFRNDVKSVFSLESTDFESDQLQVLKSRIVNPEVERFAHIDLGKTADAAGFAIGHCPGFLHMKRSNGTVEQMPIIRMDGILQIRPPRHGEILFWKIRKILYLLREMGMNVKWVSFDSWQSYDSQQLLRQKGFTVGEQSMDITTGPYDFTKTAVLDGRLLMPHHAVAKKEMTEIQRDMRTLKIDHLPHGSKDVADSIAGVVYGLTLRREIWGRYGIPITQIIDYINQQEKSKKAPSDA